MKNTALKTTGLKKVGFWQELSRHRVLYLMFLPLLLYYLVYAYFPMAGAVVAFKDFNYRDGIFASPWNGFANFRYFFRSGQAWLVTRNTMLYNVAFLALYTLFSIMVAVMISEIRVKWFKKISQSLMFMPYFISWVVVSAFLYNLFNTDYGLISGLIRFFGGKAINIYSADSSVFWMFMLPLLYVWKWVGYGSVLYLAAIMGIDRECYESADIDGANIFQRIRYVTIPMLKPTIITLVLLGVSRIMRGEFDMFFQIIGNNGALFPTTDIIDTLVFRSVVSTSDFPMASASGLYQSVLCFLIIYTVNFVVKKTNADYALF